MKNEPISIQQMTFKKPLGPNLTVIIMVPGKSGRENNPPTDGKTISFLYFGTTWVDLGSYFGAYQLLKGSPNRAFFEKINIKLEKRVCRKVSQKNMILGFIFDVRMGGLDEPKQAFRIMLLAKDKFSWSCET